MNNTGRQKKTYAPVLLLSITCYKKSHSARPATPGICSKRECCSLRVCGIRRFRGQILLLQWRPYFSAAEKMSPVVCAHRMSAAQGEDRFFQKKHEKQCADITVLMRLMYLSHMTSDRACHHAHEHLLIVQTASRIATVTPYYAYGRTGYK